ncbi:MAG TPA: hypothetical protein VGO57_00380 [Verrucomicrobiae bacterium]
MILIPSGFKEEYSSLNICVCLLIVVLVLAGWGKLEDEDEDDDEDEASCVNQRHLREEPSPGL